jgi:hypothetical protein
LAIVREVALAVNATVSLADPARGIGLVVTVEFDRAADAAPDGAPDSVARPAVGLPAGQVIGAGLKAAS